MSKQNDLGMSKGLFVGIMTLIVLLIIALGIAIFYIATLLNQPEEDEYYEPVYVPAPNVLIRSDINNRINIETAYVEPHSRAGWRRATGTMTNISNRPIDFVVFDLTTRDQAGITLDVATRIVFNNYEYALQPDEEIQWQFYFPVNEYDDIRSHVFDVALAFFDLHAVPQETIADDAINFIFSADAGGNFSFLQTYIQPYRFGLHSIVGIIENTGDRPIRTLALNITPIDAAGNYLTPLPVMPASSSSWLMPGETRSWSRLAPDNLDDIAYFLIEVHTVRYYY